MDDTLQTILLAAIPGILSLIVVLLQRRKDIAASVKDESEASDTITESALKLVEPLKKRIGELETQVCMLEKKVEHQELVIHKYAVGTNKLIKKLMECNISVPWTPVGIEGK